MKCDPGGTLLQRLADRELGPVMRWRLERHMLGCRACAAAFAALQTLRCELQSKLSYHRAPPSLAGRIGAALARERPPPKPARARWRPWLRPAGAGFAGVAAGIGLTLLVMNNPGRPSAADATGDLIASHIRSLMPGHLIDVESSDQHTVKPWLGTRLNVSPPVRDLGAEGFPLIGGRLDYLEGHPSAAVVYKRRQHVINLFAWASAGLDQPVSAESRQGFNVLRWKKDGIAFAAVSDLDAKELGAFAAQVAKSP